MDCYRSWTVIRLFVKLKIKIMSVIENDLDYWKVEVDGEEWIVDGANIKDVIKKVLVEEPDADIDLVERTNISRVIF
tara:strand:+ start:197 stop:427 length:231 start_codon:yes stop_codon:yes gene_type:complete